MYEHWVSEAERYARLKKIREDGLRAMAARMRLQGEALFTVKGKYDRAKHIEHVANGLINNDSLVKEYQLMHERALANAQAYGAGR